MTDYELYGRTDLDPDEILRRAYTDYGFDYGDTAYDRSSSDRAALYGDEGYGEGMTGAQTSVYDSTLGATGSPSLSRLLSSILGIGGDVAKFATSNSGLLGLLAALAASKERRPAYGGGTRMAMPAPVVPQRMAAQGGLMKAYRQGGPVRMEDGGFVMTKRAVDGAGGPRGLAQMLPGARPIRGPGTGTSDSIPATINGPRGQTPARVSNGEAYVPRRTVQNAGGAQQLYDLMHKLQRRA